MTELQEKLLLLLRSFHDICQSNDLRYYAIGGTALGAMRHNGFIPWDDDLDVAMPRKDYEKLKELSNSINANTTKYRFEFPGENVDFVYPFGKMYDTNTTLIENTRFKTKRGLFLDVFPLDGLGNTYEEAVNRFTYLEKKVYLILTFVCAWRKGRQLYKNLAVLAMQCIPIRILNIKQLLINFEEECKKIDFDDSIYVAPCGAPEYHEKIISRHEWYGTPREHNFENTTIFLPEKPEEFLTEIFGDWRKLPPKEKQCTHHDYLSIDLNNPYIK